MKTNLSLNKKKLTIECDEREILFSVLRQHDIKSIKCGCKKGLCGSCSVLIDNKHVPSCIVPIASVQNKEVITIESFSLTKEYADIMTGLERANVTLCGFCNTGKIFAIHEIISTDEYPNRNDIQKKLKTFTCACSTNENLIDAIYKAYDVRYERIGKEKYGRK